MSRQSVRNGVAQWFQPPAVAGLSKVYTAQPRQVPGTDFFAGETPGTASGMIAYPFIERQHERRIALGGAHSGWKEVTYDMGLVLRFVSNQQHGESASDDFDAIVDAAIVRLRADRTLNGAVWQAGEGEEGGTDVEVVADLPHQRQPGGPIVIWGVLRFKAIEMDQT